MTKQYKYLHILLLIYVIPLLFINWFNARIIDFHFLYTDGGTLIFPITLMVSDIVTEVYGYKIMRRFILIGFILMLAFASYSLLIGVLPNPPIKDAPYNDAFNQVLSILTFKALLVSSVVYFISEPLNSFLVAKMKIWFNGKWMTFRFITSTAISSWSDSFLFAFLFFITALQISTILKIAFSAWVVKMLVEIVGAPFSVKISKRLKKLEGIDTYDRTTKFYLFSKDVTYK